MQVTDTIQTPIFPLLIKRRVKIVGIIHKYLKRYHLHVSTMFTDDWKALDVYMFSAWTYIETIHASIKTYYLMLFKIRHKASFPSTKRTRSFSDFIFKGSDHPLSVFDEHINKIYN